MEYWNTILRNKINKVATLVLLFISIEISAQTVSSYSALGIGDISETGFVNYIGNGLGLSKGEFWFVNQMNPALLPYNQATTFQVGTGFEAKTVLQNDIQDNYSSMNLLYFGSSIPAVAGKWTFSLGVQPYSRVLFSFSGTQSIPNSSNTAEITLEGSGGFNQAYFGHGFKITKDLSIGVKASYIFSSIIKESTTFIGDTLDPSTSARATFLRINASDVVFSTGIAYKHKLNSDLTANYGVTFEPESKISVKIFDRVDVRTPAGSVLDIDTLAIDVSSNIRTPQKWGFGFSVNKGFNWTLGLEGEYQQWSRYRDISGRNTNLQDSYAIRFGGDWVPDPFALENYFNRVTYRFGVSYERLPFILANENVNEYGFSVGWSMPVSRISYIDFGLRYAVRGSSTNGLIRENFFQVQLGFTFNDRWFLRTAFD